MPTVSSRSSRRTRGQKSSPVLKELRNWPDVRQVKNFKDRSDYRLRVGRYRVFFKVTVGVIWITEVLLRDGNTY